VTCGWWTSRQGTSRCHVIRQELRHDSW